MQGEENMRKKPRTACLYEGIQGINDSTGQKARKANNPNC
jgi:hypothetical protein